MSVFELKYVFQKMRLSYDYWILTFPMTLTSPILILYRFKLFLDFLNINLALIKLSLKQTSYLKAFSKLAHKSSDKIFMLPKNLDLSHKLLPKESYMKKYLYEMRAI